MSTKTENYKILLFANDTLVVFSNTNIQTIEKQTIADLNLMAQWMEKNGLHISAEKSSSIQTMFYLKNISFTSSKKKNHSC